MPRLVAGLHRLSPLPEFWSAWFFVDPTAASGSIRPPGKVELGQLTDRGARVVLRHLVEAVGEVRQRRFGNGADGGGADRPRRGGGEGERPGGRNHINVPPQGI